MKQWKRSAAAIIAAAALCGALPASALPVQNLLSGVVLTAHADDIPTSGYCGDPDVNDGKDVTWKLENGVLTISGTGAMEDFYDDPGWYYYCDSVTNVVIENGVTSVGDYAFYQCSNLISVTIPDSVTSIGVCAFYRCESLLSITIPYGITRIGEAAFDNCSNLTSVTIPNSVTSIGYNTFAHCSNLNSVTIPNSVTSIGYGAFSYCSNLISVTIPYGVTHIAENAFYFCTNLTSVTIPNSVTSIGYNTFAHCSNLNSVTIPNSVTSIGYGAFSYCTNLTSVTIPESVTSIGSNAFYLCSSLKSVYFEGETPPDLGNFAFQSTHHDLKIYVPASAVAAYKKAWNNLADRIFSNFTYEWNCGAAGDNCKATLTADGTLTISGTGAMADYPDGKPGWHLYRDSITNVVIKNGVTSIGEYAFFECGSLTDVTIPDSVTGIGKYAFYDCGSLTDVTIPNSVTGIGKYAFYYCSSLTSVTIPAGVTSIGDNVFRNCTSLESVLMKGETPPQLGISVLTNTHSNLRIHVPAPSGNTYKNAWSTYAGKIVEYLVLTEEACYPVDSKGVNKVHVGFSVNVPEDCSLVDYGLIYYNSGNVIHTEHLTLENVGVSGIKQAKYWNANITDLGYGVTAVGYVLIRNANQTVDTYYTGELGGSFEAMTNAAKYVKLIKQENHAMVSGGKQKVYVGFDANVPNCYTVSDYGLIYYNSGNVIHTEHLTLENVGICGISKAKYWGANITDNGYGVTAVGFVKVKDAFDKETVIYSEELGGSFTAISKAAAEKAVTLTRQQNKAVVSGGKNKVYVGFNAKIAADYTVKDYGLIYYNSGTVITTPYLTLENVGVCGITKAKYWGANITDIGYGVTAVGFVTVEDSNGCVTTLYTEELGGSFTAISEAAAANAVTLTRQANKAVVSGGKNKVYVGFNANVAEGYTVEDYGLIYYNSGTVITTPYLTLENVGICGISQAKYWGANITDNGYGVTAVGFVKVKDANGYVTTLYTGELGAKFANLTNLDL